MKQFALIENGVVVNVIDVGPDSWDEGIEITDLHPRPGIGWRHDDHAGFTAPAVPESDPAPGPVPPNRIITNYAFDMRFSLDERVAIEMAGLDDPAASMDARAQAAALRVSQERAKKAQFTDLDNPIVRASVEQMEAGGLLAPGRAAEILDTPVLDDERP